MRVLNYLVPFLLIFQLFSCSDDLNQNINQEEVLESRREQRCCDAEVKTQFIGTAINGCKQYIIYIKNKGYCDLTLLNVSTKEKREIPAGIETQFLYVLCDDIPNPIETPALEFQLSSKYGVCESFNASSCCDGLEVNSIVVVDKVTSDCCNYKLFGTNSSECELVAIANGQPRTINPGNFSVAFTVCKKDAGLIPLSITSGGTRCYVFEPSENVSCW